MTYTLQRRLFVENGPTQQASDVAATRAPARFLLWRTLDSERRLKAIEKALNGGHAPAHDGLPLAL